MTVQPIRTWTLHPDEPITLERGDYEGPELNGEAARVIELEPVLDLLAAWVENDGLGAMEHEEATAALLREHGRLQ